MNPELKKLPSFDSVRTTMSRSRKAAQPNAPQSKAEIAANILNQIFDIDGSPFLLKDSGPTDPDLVQVFGASGEVGASLHGH